MEVRRFADAASFYRRAEPFLIRREAEHNLLLGIATVLMGGQSYGDEPPYFATVEDGGVALAALRTPPHNLLLSRAATPDAVELVARDLHASGQELPGVTGPTAVSAAFAARWQALAGTAVGRARAMRVYQLAAVRPAAGAPGRLRRATEADRALLVEWLVAFQGEALGDPDRPGAVRSVERLLGADPRTGGVYVWEDGTPVATASYTGPTPSGIRVVNVYTPPEQRRRGYASACVAGLSQHLLDSGRRLCFLHTDLANPTSNHIYQAIGYAPVGDIDEYHFG